MKMTTTDFAAVINSMQEGKAMTPTILRHIMQKSAAEMEAEVDVEAAAREYEATYGVRMLDNTGWGVNAAAFEAEIKRAA
ncbi:hypothetical protein UFOVP233_51 [uncultured Caudovirales phage]|uniref:Uncharacterized protein n=1 Tax=uncultured Caudovirales phage TaxID=2100421 RepID=A0A6J7WU41_9CAUD|nr:hypothetical protein UFOVP233_51 [uncultured Caudovirales phage]